MDAEQHLFQSLRDRLDRLEKGQRRSRLLALGGWGLLSILVLLGQAPLKGKVLEAQAFQLRDSSGELRASLEILDRGPRLLFFDVKGNPPMDRGRRP